jgi:hypothetical protein
MDPTNSQPLKTTFSILGRTSAGEVAEVLAAALSVPCEAIQFAASEALLARVAISGHLAVLEKLDSLPESVTDLVRRQPHAVAGALRQSLLSGNAATRRVGWLVIRRTEQFEQFANLLELMTLSGLPDREALEDTFRWIVNRLYDHWQSGVTDPAATARALAVRQRWMADLLSCVDRFDDFVNPELILEAMLILGEPSDAIVKRWLWHGTQWCRELADRLLLESRHPGVLRFLAKSLEQRYPHPFVLQAIQQRSDLEFVSSLLRSISQRNSSFFFVNLQQLSEVTWLELPLSILDTLPTDLQPALCTFVQATPLPRSTKSAVQEWMLQYGTAAGRQAAESLAPIDTSVWQYAVQQSLDSDDADVQAWATSQLRAHGIPEAFSLLVERVNSPHAVVREAARKELAGFETDRVLGLCDSLSNDEARRVGQLLLQVDLEALAKLRRKLAHPARQKRLQTARSVAKLGLATQLIDAVVTLAEDSDPLIRRSATEILVAVESDAARRTLEQLANDPHPRVHEAAQKALEEWNRQFGITDATHVDSELLHGFDMLVSSTGDMPSSDQAVAPDSHTPDAVKQA